MSSYLLIWFPEKYLWLSTDVDILFNLTQFGHFNSTRIKGHAINWVLSMPRRRANHKDGNLDGN